MEIGGMEKTEGEEITEVAERDDVESDDVARADVARDGVTRDDVERDDVESGDVARGGEERAEVARGVEERDDVERDGVGRDDGVVRTGVEGGGVRIIEEEREVAGRLGVVIEGEGGAGCKIWGGSFCDRG